MIKPLKQVNRIDSFFVFFLSSSGPAIEFRELLSGFYKKICWIFIRRDCDRQNWRLLNVEAGLDVAETCFYGAFMGFVSVFCTL